MDLNFEVKNLTLAQARILLFKLTHDTGVRDMFGGTMIMSVQFQRATYKLYYYVVPDPDMRPSCVQGNVVYRHLCETGLIHRALSLESDVVKGWLWDRSSYPEELKGFTPYLWGSIRDGANDREVATLFSTEDKVEIVWQRIYQLGPATPSLLSSE